MDRPILLSGPHVDETDREAILRAFDGGWIAPVGPELSAFEQELTDYVGAESCVALASGTAALQLGLLDAGVKSGDEVVVQTATFAASAFAVAHIGARPVFCDVDAASWTIDPDLLEGFLAERAKIDRLPKAFMPVDLYGSCADYPRLEAIANSYGVALVEDAAEALGSITTNNRMAGSFGASAALSFNGNKIMTTSGGGALLGSTETVERARYLSTQARVPGVLYYQHDELGYNFRMSNLLAALGRSQLAALEPKIERRHELNSNYRSNPDFGEFEWCPYAHTDRPNHWLTVALLPERLDPQTVCSRLGDEGIEARPWWKPMHCQPVFESAETIEGAVSEQLFARGICLPSGSTLTETDEERVHVALAKAISR